MENLTNLMINISDISTIFTAFLGFVFTFYGIVSAIKLAKRS
ncbi:hypothetical protein [Aliarcobacter butzleri]|nr:hypothetical protein [Aliarcobacter butzleri]